MDLNPAWVKRIWETWDVRMLVVLSLTLQNILWIFGSRRKYISSLWINIVVWSSYLLADWAATVALGKLSDYEAKTALQAVWAPLLLLHLGGPDTITAYSLEDNQLWMRHLLGLVVQFSLAVYVIVTTWKNKWFSFMSFPMLVAGAIKYGERTWILKSVSDNKGNKERSRDFSEIGVSGFLKVEDKYIRALTMAGIMFWRFKHYIGNYDPFRNRIDDLPSELSIDGDDHRSDPFFWDVLEIEMGLMYDSLYTKACIACSKGGCIVRFISTVCTLTVLMGFFWLILGENKWGQEHYSKVDMVITGVLLVVALALEIYSVVLLFSSDWAMLWLIRHKRSQWVTKLRKNIPWIFQRRKYWCKKMGQFDLLGFFLKEAKPEKLSRRILGFLLGIDNKGKLDRYMHQTYVDVGPEIYDVVFEYCCRLTTEANANLNAEDRFWTLFRFKGEPFHEQILTLHFATEMCYHLEEAEEQQRNNSSSTNAAAEPLMRNMETCKILSHYMMHMCLTCPRLLPFSISESELIDSINSYKKVLKGKQVKDVRSMCEIFLEQRPENLIAPIAIANELREKQKVERWEKLKSIWLRMIFYAVSNGQTNSHLQQLKGGGELLTWLWFFLPQCEVFGLNFSTTVADAGRSLQ